MSEETTQEERKIVGQCDTCHTVLHNDDAKSVVGTRNKGGNYRQSSPIYRCARCEIKARTGKEPTLKAPTA